MKFYETAKRSLVLNPQEVKPRSELTDVSKSKDISFKTLICVYLVMSIGFLSLIPMIYIKNNIYYLSRDISVLLNEHAVLLEENIDLQRKIELIRFKNQVLDTLEIK